MSQQTTIRKLAELVNAPVEKLLEQLAEAGMSFNGPDQVVTSTEKMKLLGFLRRTHGKADKPAEDAAAPKKITLNRSRKQELTVGGGKNRSHGRRASCARRSPWSSRPKSPARTPQTDERAEILRKLEESRQRNLSEQQRLAEADKRRAEEAAERQRLEAEAAARRSAEAARIAALPADGRGRRAQAAHGHGHRPPQAGRRRASRKRPATSTSPTAARTRWSPASRTTRTPRASPASCT